MCVCDTCACVLDAVVHDSCPVVTDFVCGSGDCVEARLVCDSKADCEDGSDERHCGEGLKP